MRNRSSFLGVTAAACLAVASVTTSQAEPISVPKPKDSQIFTQPGKFSNNTTPSGVIINNNKPPYAQQDKKPAGLDPSKIVTQSGSIHHDTKPPWVDPSKINVPKPSSEQGQGCGNPGEPACKDGGGGIGNGNCGHPGQPACKIGGVNRCKGGAVGPDSICSSGSSTGDGNARSPFPNLPGKVIIVDRDTEYRTKYVPVYRERYVPVPGPTIAIPAAPEMCLTKDYLQTGVVLFKDVCTKEWALNSTTVDQPVTAATARTCLTKESPASGVVLFKDLCSNEWAMNPPEGAEDPESK